MCRESGESGVLRLAILLMLGVRYGCDFNIANSTGAPGQMKVSQGVAIWAVLTSGCFCFKDFLEVFLLFILDPAVVEKEDGFILGCEAHGDNVDSFIFTDLRLWHTERTNFVILTSFFRVVSLYFPPLPWAEIAELKCSVPKGLGLFLFPVLQSPSGLI